MKARRFALVTLSLLSLSGCTIYDSYNEVEALNEAQPVGNPFTQALADEYRAFANREFKEMFDFPDALHFARKGLAASAGDNVMPEPVTDWNLEPEQVQELSAARGRLLAAYNLAAREIVPAKAAAAQVRYDCWIEQQEENDEPNEILSCKQGFMTVLAELESEILAAQENGGDIMTPAPSETEATPLAYEQPKTPLADEDAVFLVFFDFNGTKISGGADSVVEAVSQQIALNNPKMINIVGHTDTAGPKSYNQRLAFKRANAVRDALVARGISAELIKVDAKGEDDLLVATADNVREPANRRVNITFTEEKAESFSF